MQHLFKIQQNLLTGRCTEVPGPSLRRVCLNAVRLANALEFIGDELSQGELDSFDLRLDLCCREDSF